MSRKTLLFLSAAHCHVCIWHNGRLSAPIYFAGSDKELEQFAGFVKTHRDPALLLTDLIEEDFRTEDVPHLRGGERDALIRRKLEQYYRNTPFRLAVLLRRRSDGRRDDDMLFSALTNPALISPWLDIMLTHNVALVGIYSLPHISAPLLSATPPDHLLLLSWEKYAGLRQSYFDTGRLRFSRLTPFGGNTTFGATAATEAARTQQYLKNLSQLPPGAPLHVQVICHANDRLELEAQLSGDNDLHFACLDLQELGRRIGANSDYTDSDATPLFLHLLATRSPHTHYAAAEHTHFLLLSQLRRALFGTCAAIAAGCALWTAANLMQGMALEENRREIEAQTAQLSQQSVQIIHNFPDALAPASEMKTAVLLSRQLDNASPPPQLILDGLSRTLDEFPALHIAKLSWQTNRDEAAIAHDPVILLDGELDEFGGGYRAALDYVERFRQALIGRGYEATAQSLPLDVSPQGSIADSSLDGRHAQFSLKIFRRAAT